MVVKFGVDALPNRLKDFLLSQINIRPALPSVYHITGLTHCLRKLWYRIKFPEECGFSLESCYHIFRGSMFDKVFTSLFPIHQKTYIQTKRGVTITGTLDFLMFDDDLGERILVDLKCPKNTYYLKKESLGRIGYQRQVLAYLALAKVNNELMDVKRCRILSIADDVIVHEYGESPDILESFFWPRAFILHAAVISNNSSILMGPEENWECNNKFCPASQKFREECDAKIIEREKMSSGGRPPQTNSNHKAMETLPPEEEKKMKELLY